MKESSSQIVCGERDKSRCSQGVAGSLPQRRLAGEVQCRAVPHLEPVADRNAILTRLTSGLLTALLSSRPGLYPRHRWTGCDLATDDVGIVEACHSLPSTTYRPLRQPRLCPSEV